MEGLFFGAFFSALFFWRLFVFAQERKKEATRTWREHRTLSPKKSVGCKTLSPKGVLVGNTLSPKRSAGLQNPKP